MSEPPSGAAPIELETLTDGGQKPADVARGIAGFLAESTKSLDIALYDVRFETDAGGLVLAALLAAVQRGVAVRILYNVDHPGPIAVPPPPETTPDSIEALPVPTRGVAGVPDLMHHKYMIRDSHSVWTGSMNWTDDSWTRQENVVAIVDSPLVAAAFHREFEQLVGAGTVGETGRVPPEWRDGIRVWFTPGYGEDLSHRIALAVGQAKRRVRICSPVLTTPPVVGALAGAVVAGRVDVAGCVDGPQTRQAAHQWSLSRGRWKVRLLERLAGRFSAKPSTPYGVATVHDFMHAKVTVCDDTVFVGSFNLSRSGERNAENVIELEDAELADTLAAFVDGVRGRYAPLEL